MTPPRCGCQITPKPTCFCSGPESSHEAACMEIRFCNLHGQAEALREALERMVNTHDARSPLDHWPPMSGAVHYARMVLDATATPTEGRRE